MEKTFKMLIKTAFFTLMLAVALRPVVVNSSANVALPEASGLQVHEGLFTCLSAVFPACFLSQVHEVSSLRVIPKEIPSVAGLAPRFAQSGLSPDLCQQPLAVFLSKGFSSPKSLVLRI